MALKGFEKSKKNKDKMKQDMTQLKKESPLSTVNGLERA